MILLYFHFPFIVFFLYPYFPFFLSIPNTQIYIYYISDLQLHINHNISTYISTYYNYIWSYIYTYTYTVCYTYSNNLHDTLNHMRHRLQRLYCNIRYVAFLNHTLRLHYILDLNITNYTLTRVLHITTSHNTHSQYTLNTLSQT